VSSAALDTGRRAAPAPRLHGLASGSALNLLGAGVSAVAGLALVIVVTRSLSQSVAGVFFTLTSLFLLAEMVVSLGAGTGLVYFTARSRSLGEAARIRAFQRVALTPVLVLSLLATVAFVIGAPAIAHAVGGSPGTRGAVVVLALLLPLAAASDTLLAGTRGHGTMLPTVVIERIGRPAVQLGLVALVAAGGALELVSGAWALPWVCTAGLAGWWLVRLGRDLPGAGSPVGGMRATWREFWGFTWARAVNSVVQLALQRLDIVLITVLIGPVHAAVYTAATRFLIVGQLSSASVTSAAQPRLAELLAVDDRASTKTVYQSATAWIVLLTWPLYVLCAVFADDVLTVFGAGYASGRTVIVILAAAMLVATGCGMVDTLLNMAGRTSWTLGNSLVALAVMVGADLMLIPRLGILGAGIGWAAAIVVNNALPLTQLIVSLRLHPFGAATLRAGALSLACFGALPLAARLLAPGAGLLAAGAAALGALVFVLTCVRWRRALGLPRLRELRPRGGRSTPTRSTDPAVPGGAA
jgi:O-antigen/teichoic acid export membrane protein